MQDVMLMILPLYTKGLDVGDVEDYLPGIIHLTVTGNEVMFFEQVEERAAELPDSDLLAEEVRQVEAQASAVREELCRQLQINAALPALMEHAQTHYVSEVTVQNDYEVAICWRRS